MSARWLAFRVTELFARWFPERQIIVREKESVRAIRLAPKLQLLAACAVAIGGIWTVSATGAYVQGLFRAIHRQGGVASLPELPGVSAAPALGNASHADASTAEQSGKPERQVFAAQERADELEGALTAARQMLDQAQAARLAALAERDSLAARLTDSETRMRVATTEHEAALNRLNQETRRSIAEVERIISAAGLDPARLAPQSVSDGRGQNRGGPFVPWNKRLSDLQKPQSRFPDRFDSDIARLDELKRLLRATPLAAPLNNFTVTSPFGRRTDPFNGEAAFHEGIDLQAPLHTPVTATAPGRVVFAGRSQSYGLMVEIEHSSDIHTRYAHLDRISVAAGQPIAFRQVVGLLGQTGRASGPHLHYEVLVDGQPHDPLNFLKAASNVRKNH